ncbi:MAG: hypothetical protein H9893_02750 [Candidatus Niameybacter stercoravium]|nr:hypothetical protein [Candidatus Niameybacter stercoravium]
MNPIHLYCKANKRKRNGEAVGAYAYILKGEDLYKEEIQVLKEETRVARLELLALSEGLKDLDTQEKLGGKLYIYVSNEYLLEELLKGMEDQLKGKPLNFNKGTGYVALWEAIENYLTKSKGYKVIGLNKKDRGEDEEAIKAHMGLLNKIVCDAINQHLPRKA